MGFKRIGMKAKFAVLILFLVLITFSCDSKPIIYSQLNHPVSSIQGINDVREGYGRINIEKFPGKNPGHGQSFSVDFDTINGVEVFLVSPAKGYEDDITLQLRDSSLNIIAELTKKIRTPLEIWVDFEFDSPVKISADQQYYVFVFGKTTTIHWAYAPGKYKWGTAIINTKKIRGMIFISMSISQVIEHN